MRIEKYNLKAQKELTRFEFISEGPRGAVRKLIEFQTTTVRGIYNLAFGDKDNRTGEIDDLAVSANGDTEKVLATVISAVYVFFDRYPDAFIQVS